MKKYFRISILALFLVLAGCALGRNTGKSNTDQTQLEARQYQTREYETKDAKMVLKAMLNVLQDDGFMIQNANVELGLLSAYKDMNVESAGDKFWSTVWLGKNARWKKNSRIDCTANVSEFGKNTRVRVTFQEKILDNKGEVAKLELINDPSFYQAFFTKVSKGLFIQTEGL
ncbi:MAG: hypothetical protein A3H42_01515 [Deltaproteobacteria bacterium RIFCSPLOWO2_02_FULL_46_8]|nr:MAG: hypothetical protein A3H42_01515 [Deltaproteobacteria bacterium RIFCSPLOWO2_02_FULL_46_8]